MCHVLVTSHPNVNLDLFCYSYEMLPALEFTYFFSFVTGYISMNARDIWVQQ